MLQNIINKKCSINYWRIVQRLHKKTPVVTIYEANSPNDSISFGQKCTKKQIWEPYL